MSRTGTDHDDDVSSSDSSSTVEVEVPFEDGEFEELLTKWIEECAKEQTVMFLLVRFMRDQDDSYEIVQILWLKDGRAK